MNTLDFALQYAQQGWPVFPVNGKIPLIKGWPDAATTDAEQLTAWWVEWPAANVGIVTGPRSGLMILDVDGPPGEASLAQLIVTHGDLPETLTVKTGKGGHLYFKHPADAAIKNDVGRKLGMGLDVRAMGGYVVAPGSRHASGAAYEWIDPDVPLASPPNWLIQLLTQEPDERPPVAPAMPLDVSKTSRYATGALTNACALVAGAPVGSRNATLNGQAYGVGQLIGANALTYPEAESHLMSAALSAGLPRSEAQATIRSGLKAGMQAPRNLAHVGPEPLNPPQLQAVLTQAQAPAMALQAFSALELMEKEFKAPRWAIPHLLPQGLTILAGRPKTGKSWLAFDIALAIARGAKALGNRPVQQGEVLYLALEDHERRLQDRLLQLVQDETAPDTLFFTCAAPRFDQGGLPAIIEWLENHPDCRLVILDTLGRFRPPAKKNGDSYAEDTILLGNLQRMAVERSLAVVVIHHTRKSTADNLDPLDEVLGSTGITGTADAVWVLKRGRTESTANLFITGRDIGEEAMALEFDSTACTWQLQVEPEHPTMSLERQKILNVLKQAPEPLGPKEIATMAGCNYDSVRHMIRQMEAEGSVLRKARGKYVHQPRSHPSQEDEDPLSLRLSIAGGQYC